MSEGARDYVPYSERPDWSDVEPEEVTDDQGKVISIQYTDEHKEALSYFRAVLAKGEKSERVLKLMEHMIKLNSADYTAWQYRWEVLEALHADMDQEHAFTRQVALENAKNYQLWNHRRKMSKALGAPFAEQELAFVSEALELDEKNYHAWAHRQFLVQLYGSWQQELEYVEAMIARDVRNNSAWNQRAFLTKHAPRGDGKTWEVLLQREVEYVAEQVAVAPKNESAWNYLWGLFTLEGAGPWDMGRCTEVFIICAEALRDSPSSSPALDTLARYYLCLAGLAAQQGAAQAASTASKHAVEVLRKARVADPMRGNYWRYREVEVQEVLQALHQAA